MTKNKSPFGRPSGSINAPIAAFTMAVVLCSYCFSSIRSARREAHSLPTESPRQATRSSNTPQTQSWVQQALENQNSERKGPK
ncbi:hypothetical protein BDV59DRAFT_205636 [Aspergillus ambiguus]|uniref:uncharacterized protein n=1 Tax=Aspergillus ambiguus TaxID=176160 RepID=UPI003CCD7C84